MKFIAHQQFILSLVQEIRIEDKLSKRLTNGANYQVFYYFVVVVAQW